MKLYNMFLVFNCIILILDGMKVIIIFLFFIFLLNMEMFRFLFMIFLLENQDRDEYQEWMKSY